MPSAIHNVIQDTVGAFLGKEQTVWRDGVLVVQFRDKDPGPGLLLVLPYDKIETGTRPRKVIASGFKAWFILPWAARVHEQDQAYPLATLLGPGEDVREVSAADLDRLAARDLFFRLSAAFSDLDALADWAVTNMARHQTEFEQALGRAVTHGGMSVYFTLYDRRKVPATAEAWQRVEGVVEGSIVPKDNPHGETWWKHPEDECETRKQLKEHIARYCRMLQHYVLVDV